MLTITGINTNVLTNQTSQVAILHLYYDASNYLKLATEAITIGSDEYRGVVSDIGTWQERWNIEGDNSVTQSTPSIKIKNEVYPDRSGSIIDTLFGNTYIGNRAVVKLGYAGLAAASYVTIYDGRVDDIELDGDIVTINLVKFELPATHIGGRKINGQLIGTDDYSASITVPDQSDGRYLPVPFGNHWNAPIVLYRKNDSGVTYWAYCDLGWDATDMNASETAGIRALAFQRDNLWQSGTYQTQACILIPNDGKLVPLYQKSPYASGAVIFRDTDAACSDTIGVIAVDAPGGFSGTVHYGEMVTTNVPLRFYQLTGSGHTAVFTNVTGSPDSDDINLMLSDDIDDMMTLVSDTGGTNSKVVFNAWLDIDRQLRTDSRFCVNPNWPIHIPAPSDDSGGDQWTVLLMAIASLDDGVSGDDSFKLQGHVFAFRVGNNQLTYDIPDPSDTTWNGTTGWLDEWDAGTDWENFIGCTWWGEGAQYPRSNFVNGGQTAGYNYVTHVRQNDGGAVITTENIYSIEDDSFSRPFFGDISDMGNGGGPNGTTPVYSAYPLITEAMLTFPYLRRDALDVGVAVRVEILFNDALGDTEDVTANFKAFYLEAIETVGFEYDSDKYTFVKGYQDTNYSGELATFTAEFAEHPYQYIEAILRRKIGAAAADLHSEWSGIQEAYDDFFNDDRKGSGFVTPTDEELPFDDFIKEYCENEPFTIYRDQLGLYRWLQVPIDITSLNGRSFFTAKRDSIDYNDCDLGFSIKFTDKSKICAEVKECLTDYIYHDGGFAQNEQWKIASGGSYAYDFWNSENTYNDNLYFVERIEKKYTSYPEVSIVKDSADSTKGYNCVITNEGTSIPLVRSAYEDVKYWTPLAGDSSLWGTPTSYTNTGQAGHWVGWDAENKSIAAYKINQWCNRHRVVTCASQNPEFLKYEIGDLIQFQNVPYSCLGLTINGFNGNSVTNTVTVNGQDVYSWFIVTRVTKSLGRVELECLQLHQLDAFIVERKSKIPNRKYDGERNIPATSIGKLSQKLARTRALRRQ
jgi:hypothetical protein